MEMGFPRIPPIHPPASGPFPLLNHVRRRATACACMRLVRGLVRVSLVMKQVRKQGASPRLSVLQIPYHWIAHIATLSGFNDGRRASEYSYMVGIVTCMRLRELAPTVRITDGRYGLQQHLTRHVA